MQANEVYKLKYRENRDNLPLDSDLNFNIRRRLYSSPEFRSKR